jgi:hypothetical protein
MTGLRLRWWCSGRQVHCYLAPLQRNVGAGWIWHWVAQDMRWCEIARAYRRTHASDCGQKHGTRLLPTDLQRGHRPHRCDGLTRRYKQDC